MNEQRISHVLLRFSRHIHFATALTYGLRDVTFAGQIVVGPEFIGRRA